MTLPDDITRWQAGRVDRSAEHMELRYGNTDRGGWDDWLPTVLIGPPVDGVINVEFLVDRHSPDNARMIADVLHAVQVYLIDKCEIPRPPDFIPWAYAIYHCSTMCTLQSTGRTTRLKCRNGDRVPSRCLTVLGGTGYPKARPGSICTGALTSKSLVFSGGWGGLWASGA